MDVVTGAFGYIGKYIARRLLAEGRTVRTLTGQLRGGGPFGDRVEAFPFNFERPAELTRSLRGATTLYNTYWIRFSRGGTTFDTAVRNTEVLLQAAREAGVRRVVHISVTNASDKSPLPYFRGKGQTERLVLQSGLSYSIIRPALAFGTDDILTSNIAWFLRKFPFFPIPGAGDYPVQPICVDELADLAVRAGQAECNTVLDAVGPETCTYIEMVRLIARSVGSRAGMVRVSPSVSSALAGLMGLILRDVVLTRDEVQGLMSGLLVSSAPPTGQVRLSQWLVENGERLGTRYASELARHFRR